MRTKQLILGIALVTFLLSSLWAQGGNDIKLALIADRALDLYKSPLASLLEVRLSQREGIQLLERTQIDKILQEQKLSVAGLVEREQLIKVGRLLRADGLLLLSIENAKDELDNLPEEPSEQEIEDIIDTLAEACDSLQI